MHGFQGQECSGACQLKTVDYIDKKFTDDGGELSTLEEKQVEEDAEHSSYEVFKNLNIWLINEESCYYEPLENDNLLDIKDECRPETTTTTTKRLQLQLRRPRLQQLHLQHRLHLQLNRLPLHLSILQLLFSQL